MPNRPAEQKLMSRSTLVQRSLAVRTRARLPAGRRSAHPREGRTIVYANQAFTGSWNVPEEHYPNPKDDSALLPLVASQVADTTAAFVSQVERLYRSPEALRILFFLKDGRVISGRSVAFEEEGELQTRAWIFTDITEVRQGYCRPVDRTAQPPCLRPRLSEIRPCAERWSAPLRSDHGCRQLQGNLQRIYGHAAGDDVLRQSRRHPAHCPYGDRTILYFASGARNFYFPADSESVRTSPPSSRKSGKAFDLRVSRTSAISRTTW